MLKPYITAKMIAKDSLDEWKNYTPEYKQKLRNERRKFRLRWRRKWQRVCRTVLCRKPTNKSLRLQAKALKKAASKSGRYAGLR